MHYAMWRIFGKKPDSDSPNRTRAVAPFGFSVVDVETTGLYPNGNDRIIEIAIVRLAPDVTVIDEFVSLINPGRDIGATRIHGISTYDVLRAPRFLEIAGDVADRLAGNALVAHNARFDLEFLRAEFARVPYALPFLPCLCTLHLAQQYGGVGQSYRLDALCRQFDIPHRGPHSALHDAKATALLLKELLVRARGAGASGPRDLGIEDSPVHADAWPALLSRAAPLGRDAARAHHEPSYLARLVTQLEGFPRVEAPEALEYMTLLDRVLEDRVVTDEEGAALLETARRWGLTQAQVLDIHQSYMEGLVRAALRDATVTDAERRDLERAGQLFGISADSVDAMLGAPSRSPMETAALDLQALAGLSVCFTGGSVCKLNGESISRTLSEELATRAGLVVKNSVTKKLDLLVVADPHSLSGKAEKARRYGTRIMAEEFFWRTIGIDVD